MYKIIPNHMTTHFSLSRIAGSESKRLKSARDLNEQFFNEINNFYRKENYLSFDKFKKALKKVIGKSIIVDFNPVSKAVAKDGLKYGLSVSENAVVHSGYDMSVPVTQDLKKVNTSSALMFMKLAQELFNKLCNPKVLVREFSILRNSRAKEIFEFFNNNITSVKNFDEKMLRKLLHGMTPKQKINVLQYFRYSLKMEQNSYRSPAVYKSLGVQSDVPRVIKKPESAYNFAQKFEILENMLLELIQKERVKVKAKS